MMWRTIAVLSTVWCVLVIAPALIAARLFDIATGAANTGWVIGLWIGGYLAQFGVFLVMSKRAPRGTTPGWFVAAIVPWLADWTAPVSLGWLALSAAIVVGYVIWLCWAVYLVDRLRSDGVRGTGVVLEVIRPMFNVVVHDVHVRRALGLRVERCDGAPAYEARLAGTFALGEIPEPGDRVAVLIDPARPQHLELVDAEPVQRAAADLDLAPHIADQLRRLVTMRDRGDITDSEFTAAKNRLLGA